MNFLTAVESIVSVNFVVSVFFLLSGDTSSFGKYCPLRFCHMQMVGDDFNCFRSLSTEFSYHAFIIYSQSDSDWVSRKLLPLLEEKHGLKCCIHYRDFTPGKPFQDSMAESVYNSYKIIAVLSSNFLNSNYCSYELNIAKHRLLNRRDESLVVIRIDNEDCRKLPKELRKRNFIDYSNALERLCGSTN